MDEQIDRHGVRRRQHYEDRQGQDTTTEPQAMHAYTERPRHETVWKREQERREEHDGHPEDDPPDVAEEARRASAQDEALRQRHVEQRRRDDCGGRPERRLSELGVGDERCSDPLLTCLEPLPGHAASLDRRGACGLYKSFTGTLSRRVPRRASNERP